jgi:hypothetical protein
LKKGCLIALGIPLALVAGAVALFRINFYEIHVRYRLTVEVQDGDRLRTGSSVVEASYNIEPSWTWSGPNPHVRIVGYEPTVDLGKKGLLFLSFSDAARPPRQIVERNKHVFCAADDVYCLPFEAYGEPGTWVPAHNYDRKAPLEILLRQSGPRDVNLAVLPEIIRFTDIKDSHSRRRVSPSDLAASFGSGVELKRVVLQLTADPITPMPEVWPQWLKQQRGGV